MFAKLLLVFLVLGLLKNCRSVDNPNKESNLLVQENVNVEPENSQDDNIFGDNLPKVSRGIFFLNRNTGWLPCFTNKLCRTDNGGKSWKVVSSQGLEHLTKLFFISEKLGWAVLDEWDTNRRANIVVKTEDGGITWKEVLEIDSPVFSVSFTDERNGVVSARWNGLHVTTDGGKSWKEIGMVAKEKIYAGAVREGVRYVALLDEKKAWGFGGGIWYSNDGGRGWQKMIDTGETGSGLFSSSFVTEKTGWVAGNESQLWQTTDGKHWQRIEVPASLVNGKGKDFTFYRVAFINDREGWIICNNTFPKAVSEGMLLHTDDGGKTWKKLYASSNQFVEINFLTAQKGFALDSDEQLLRTDDGGRTWSAQPIENSTH